MSRFDRSSDKNFENEADSDMKPQDFNEKLRRYDQALDIYGSDLEDQEVVLVPTVNDQGEKPKAASEERRVQMTITTSRSNLDGKKEHESNRMQFFSSVSQFSNISLF